MKRLRRGNSLDKTSRDKVWESQVTWFGWNEMPGLGWGAMAGTTWGRALLPSTARRLDLILNALGSH